MNRLPVVSIIILCLLIGCQKDDVSPETTTNYSMNLDELIAGQEFKYVLLQGYGDDIEESFYFTYSADTLTLEILDVDENKIQVRESITPASDMFKTSENYYWNKKDSIYTHTWLIENDSLKFDGMTSSHLFPRAYFPLSNDSDNFVDWNTWNTNLPFYLGTKYYHTVDFSLNEMNFDTIGIFVDNTPIDVDGAGTTIFSNKKHGIVRTSSFNPWTGKMQGWDRIR